MATPVPPGEQPDAAMMAAAEQVAHFIETGDDGVLISAFAARDVTIIENFAPFVFSGAAGVEAWAAAMRAHLAGLSSLRHSFGPAIDFSRAGDVAYFSLPTTWRGVAKGQAFSETGGWAFVVVQQAGAWRVRNYGWAVTSLTVD